MASVRDTPRIFAVDTFDSGEEITGAFVAVLRRIGYGGEFTSSGRYLLVDWENQSVRWVTTTHFNRLDLRMDWVLAEKHASAHMFKVGAKVSYRTPEGECIGTITRVAGPSFWVDGEVGPLHRGLIGRLL